MVYKPNDERGRIESRLNEGIGSMLVVEKM
jgi:hypothetical protein